MIVTWHADTAGRNYYHSGEEHESNFDTILDSDYGNICACCGAYAMRDTDQMLGVAVPAGRENQGICIGIGLDISQLEDTEMHRYVHIPLEDGTIFTIKERLVP